jgi:hypothetical protein
VARSVGPIRAYGVACKGCRIGHDTGERDIAKARCKIKLCCLSRQLETCADCPQYLVCGVLGAAVSHFPSAALRLPQAPR